MGSALVVTLGELTVEETVTTPPCDAVVVATVTVVVGTVSVPADPL